MVMKDYDLLRKRFKSFETLNLHMKILSSMKNYIKKPFTWLGEQFLNFFHNSLDQYCDIMRGEEPLNPVDLYKERREHHGNVTD